MPADSTPATRLRSAVDGATIAVVGAPFALAGRLIEEVGFEAAYVSGAAFSAGTLALPDVGLFTLDELTAHVRQLTESVSIPVIVDADTGFGEAINVERSVRRLERAGAAAIQLEDQQLPKRCGHLSGKTLVKSAEMEAKIHAAASARLDPDTILIARTDARGVAGIEAAIERALAYVEAGADWVFPEAIETVDEFRQFAAAVDVPLIANMTEFGKSPLLNVEQLADLGYAVALFPVTLLRIAMKAIEASLELLASDGTQQDLLDLMQSRNELYELLRYADYERRDRIYFDRPFEEQ